MPFPPQKKPGKPMAPPQDSPMPLKRLDAEEEPQDSMEQPEPDADQFGGPSDNDADNQIEQNVSTVLEMVPELAQPLGAMFEALANYCRKSKGEEMGEPGGAERGY